MPSKKKPVLSLPANSYDHLIKKLAKYFENIEGANIVTNRQMIWEIHEKTVLTLIRV